MTCTPPIEQRRHYVALPNGLVLNLIEWYRPDAEPSASPILLLHGLGDAASVWRDVAIALACHHAVLAVDLRGHGDSGWPADADYRVATMAADVGHFISKLSLSDITLVGHSMGGTVALHVASRYPERIGRLVLADSGPDADAKNVSHLRLGLREAHRLYPTSDAYAAVLSARHPLARRELLQWIATATTRQVGVDSVALKYDPVILQKLERAGTSGETAAGHVKSWQMLDALRCPVLVLRGSASSMLSTRTANKMAHKVLRWATLRVIPLAGHSIHLDNPEAVSEAVVQFIDYSPAQN
jgi:pimeloyl-ACP methyl ester carboxylesterase